MPRRQRITRELLLSGAMDLVDEEGLGALTMRRLGERVGADPAMVYRMFASKDDLLEALADAVFAQARRSREDRRGSSTSGGESLQGLQEAAHAIRRSLLAHPALIPVAVRRPPRHEATFRGMDAGLGVLLTAGMTHEDAAHAYQAVLFYTLGFAVLEAPFAMGGVAGTAEQQDETHRVLAALPDAQYPNIAATVEHLYTPDLDQQFEYGLQLLIAGIGCQGAEANLHAETGAT